MSKIVGLKLNLKAPQLIAASAAPLLQDHPELLRLLTQTDPAVFIRTIKNIAESALGLVADAWNGKIEKCFNQVYDGKEALAKITTTEIPHGYTLVYGSDGQLDFVGYDDYVVSLLTIRRLKSDYTAAFSCLATREVLQLCGYNTEMTKPILVDAGTGCKQLRVAVRGVQS